MVELKDSIPVATNKPKHSRFKITWRPVLLGLALGAIALLELTHLTLHYDYTPAQLASTLSNGKPEGFYGAEKDGLGNVFSWTQDKASISFNFKARDSIKLAFEVRSAAVAGGPASLVKVLLNGAEIGQLTPDPKEVTFQSFSFTLKPTNPNQTLTLSLEAQAFQPPGDKRTLGLMVKRISIDRGVTWQKVQPYGWLWLIIPLLIAGLIFVARRTNSRWAGYGAIVVSAAGAGFSGLMLVLLLRIGLVNKYLYPLWLLAILYLTLFFLVLVLRLPFGAPSASSLAWLAYERVPLRVRHYFGQQLFPLLTKNNSGSETEPLFSTAKPEGRLTRLSSYLFLALMVLVTIYRVSLLDRGSMSMVDEKRYPHVVYAAENLLDENFVEFCNALSDLDGRPGDATLRLIPAIPQVILSRTIGLHPRTPESLLIPTGFNVIVSLLILLLFYRLSLRLFRGNSWLALLSNLVYALLANTNLYIRHIFPYDLAILFLLLTLNYTLKRTPHRLSLLTCGIIGLGVGFTYTIYPGYYFFPALILVIIALRGDSRIISQAQIARYIAYGFGFLVVLGFYELIAQIGGTSYLGASATLVGTINQGSFEEGFTFLPKYLLEVERFIGVFLLVATVLYFAKTFVDNTRQRHWKVVRQDELQLICLTMLVGFLIHASASAIFHQMVFYGRLVHLYYPFLVWASVRLIAELGWPSVQKAAIGMMLACSLVSFGLFAIEFGQLGYPRDVLYQYGIFIRDETPDDVQVVNETQPHNVILSPPARDNATKAPYVFRPGIVLVNFCYFFPVGEDFTPYTPPKDAKLLYKQPYYFAYAPYRFEGYTIRERDLLRHRDYQMRIYQISEK